MPMLDRRMFLQASAAFGGAFALGAGLAAKAGGAPDPQILTARFTEARIATGGTTPRLMTYDLSGTAGSGVPPVLRMRKGEPYAARLINRLDEPTTVHWHGLRIVNAMDGVPEMTQPYVYPGEGFDYLFTPPDAGTFWYHPHCNTLMQMGSGLTGVIVVENPKDPAFDAEIVLNLRDWRLNASGAFIAPFKPRDAARGGTYGTVRTANWQREPVYDAPAGGLVRVRIAATDVTRIYSIGLEGAAAKVIALDGNPVEMPFALDRLDIGPGQRVDLALRMPENEESRATLDNSRGSSPWTIATFRAVGASLKRDLRDINPLPPNPVAEADLSTARRIPIDLTATAEQGVSTSICGTLGYTFWAINKVPWPGDTPDPVAPIEELKLGKSYVLEIANRTPHAHPIHLHGLSFRVLAANKRTVLPPPTDTILLLPDEQAQLALVADNPGDWLFHCHIIEHQKTGMAAYFRVA
ncbi:multicopper oxidase domain-containing protein [Sinorhizobium medicae]|uniref:multicopper oxidase family protein n=1 Tax=Sinorhizobium medicae TaxID=110321 RepID=UPI000C7AD532|nr:multicopper oxidase family protein [Sinorhizobium medicae]MBO1939709.1 multicopper oxidase family protein [Sinorhizobium medicae]MDX0482726.1 multicopper oxidase domain-containing protein [Sinorhizobium medicae]MDX0488915.1 multicopper oxidase domain-containing protein [Sinorhizobium medicae]MDX0496801.1 multicopper oxidase domain-containing protein [Sinorhizobium medicae]MDX0507508.1 multicopper oxidase domain-containing protein [Sinorhizobium medicae]